MTIQDFLLQNTALLQKHDIQTARLDCLVLLEDVLNTNRTHLLSHPESIIASDKKNILDTYISRRVHHEPLAYIRQKCEFYGRDFYVDHRTLIPRPESETIIDTLKDILTPQHNCTIIDVGSGSGALAITAKLEFPNAHVIAIDIDGGCLDVVSHNMINLSAEIEIISSNMLEALVAPATASTFFLCNLPYVPTTFPVNQAAQHEPPLALFGGRDGLKLYRTLFNQLQQYKNSHLHIITEAMPQQHPALLAIANKAGFTLERSTGFIQVFEN